MINKSLKSQNNPNPIHTDKIYSQMEEMGFQIQEEIDRLEEIILKNPHIPIIGKTLIDEDKLINQLDLIRINIPDALEQALEIIQQKQQIINEAQVYSQKIIENAQLKAKHILNETKIIQQAEAQANQIRKQVQQECKNLQNKTLNEVEQLKKQVRQELTKMKQEVILDSEEIQNEADDYADAMLSRLEKQLTEMLKIVHNGRKQLDPDVDHPTTRVSNPPSNQKAS